MTEEEKNLGIAIDKLAKELIEARRVRDARKRQLTLLLVGAVVIVLTYILCF